MNWLGVLILLAFAYGAGEWVWKRVRRNKPPDNYGGVRVAGPYGDVIILPEHAEHGLTPDGPVMTGPSAALPPKTWEPPAKGGAALGRRVLQDRFGSWPRLWLAGTLEKPVVTLKARYASPASNKSAARCALGAAAALGFGLTKLMEKPPLYAAGWWQTNTGAVVLGIIVAWVGFYGFRALFRRTLWRIPIWSDPLAMTFTGGGIAWAGEAQRQQWWRLNPKGRVAPTEARHAEKFPHRKAAAELRANEERRMNGRKVLPPSKLLYQQCSEVLLFVGPDLEEWRPVAELADDEQGQWAARLASAINAADDLARGKDLKKTFAAAGPGSAPGGTRPVESRTAPGRPAEPPEPGGMLE